MRTLYSNLSNARLCVWCNGIPDYRLLVQCRRRCILRDMVFGCVHIMLKSTYPTCGDDALRVDMPGGQWFWGLGQSRLLIIIMRLIMRQARTN